MSYPGSKAQAGTWQRIIGQMPPHRLYFEPFAGSAQVFRRKRPALLSWLCDLDADVIFNLHADKSRPDCPVMFSTGDAQSRLLEGGADGTLDKQALVYCDPPYLLSTRAGRRYYKHEMTDVQHAELLDILNSIPCMVMISGYPSQLYAEKLTPPHWRCISYRTRTRGRTLVECLWCNFPEPEELHDYRFTGTTYRQRQSLTKLRRRWLGKLDRMKPRNRNFLLDAIHQHHSRRGLPVHSAGNGAPR